MLRVKLIVLGLAVLPSVALMQGCLAAVWLGAVGTDMGRRSDVEFQPFENSWVAPRTVWRQQDSMSSLAVAPIVKDTPMAARLTVVLQQATDLHVISPSEVFKRVPLDTMAGGLGGLTDQDEMDLAHRITAGLGVDCVLFVREVEGLPQKSFWGWKQRHSNRLYLHLVNAEGSLVWKDELPFNVVEGQKALEEEWVRQALRIHVLAQLNKLRLAEAGLSLKKSAS